MLVVCTSPPIVSLDPEHAAQLAAVGASLVTTPCATEDDLLAACSEADGVITLDEPFTARVLGSLPRCKVIARLGIGVDRIDLTAAARAGIVVTNLPDYCVDEVSDHALGLILALSRRIVPLDAAVRAGPWDTPAVAGPVRRLRGQTLGIVGFGRTGRLLAAKAAPLGLALVVHDPFVPEAEIRAAGAEPETLAGLLRRADIVSLHVGLTPATRHLLDAQRLALLRPHAVIVNTSRGPLIDERALADALASGRLGGAALDVLEQEPPVRDNPLLGMANVMLTSHAAHWSVESGIEQRFRAVENVALVLSGRPARSPVTA